MGCNSSRSGRIIKRPHKSGGHQEQRKSFAIKIEDPENPDDFHEFSYQTENDELPIMQIMNGVAFDEGEKGTKFDANFIALMNKEKDEFEYYVQRLIGVGIENEEKPLDGKLWVPYINNKREDWSYLCDHNRIVAKEDEIVWRFEHYLQKDMLNPDELGGLNPFVENPSTKAVSRMEEQR